MDLPLTQKNAFSQFQLWNFLATGSRRQVQPPRPITPPRSKTVPPPQDIKQLQRFLGMVNFYRRFLPNCAQVLHPLTDLLKGGPRTLQWTATAQESFKKVKQLLAAVVPLQHPSPTAELSLATAAKIKQPLAAPWFFLPQID
jgi:hypothetical protein